MSPSKEEGRVLGDLLKTRAKFPLDKRMPSLWKKWLVTSLAILEEWLASAHTILEMVEVVRA